MRPSEKLARNDTEWQGMARFVSLKRTPFLTYNHHAEVFPQGSASFFLPAFKGMGAFKQAPAASCSAVYGAQGGAQTARTASPCLSAGRKHAARGGTGPSGRGPQGAALRSPEIRLDEKRKNRFESLTGAFPAGFREFLGRMTAAPAARRASAKRRSRSVLLRENGSISCRASGGLRKKGKGDCMADN